MGVGLRDLAVNAGEVEQGMDSARSQAVKDQSAALDLAAKQRTDAEAQRQYRMEAGARGVATKAYEDAKAAAAQANTTIRAQNEPEVIASEYGDVYRNRQTGEIHDDKAKAYGVVPEKSTSTIFEKEFAQQVGDYYRTQGAPEKAAALDEWSQSQTGKRYLNEAHKGLQQIALGDKQGGLQTLSDLYNSQVRDGRYGAFQDLGNGKTQLTVRDASGNVLGQQQIDDSELGQRAAQFLSPEYLAQHVLQNQAKTAAITAQFSLEAAKAKWAHEYKLTEQQQKTAQEARAKLIEYLGHGQIDAMLGKGAHVTMDQMGQHVIVTVPGQGIFELGKGGLQPVANGQFKVGANGLNVNFDDLLGSLRPGATGVQTAAPAAVQTAAPAAAPAKSAAPPDGAVQMLRASNTPEMRKLFDEWYGPGMADKLVPAARATAAAAGPTAPAATVPAAPAPTTGVRMPAPTDEMSNLFNQETSEIEAGKRKDYSREVKDYLNANGKKRAAGNAALMKSEQQQQLERSRELARGVR